MKLSSFLFILLAPLVLCRELQRAAGVGRETLFDAITLEAYGALGSIYPLPDGFQEDPLNLTTVMQLSILSGSVANVAWLLTEYNDTRALGLGFRFPLELRQTALQTTEERVTDGDVVAVKGFATAALADPSIARRLTDTFIFSAYGTPFLDRVCTVEEPAVFDDEGVPNCHLEVILDFIRERMDATFADSVDMQRILDTSPDVTVLGYRGAELPMIRANVSSWPCAYCFEEAFCLANSIHCPYSTPEELAFGFGLGDALGSAEAPEDDLAFAPGSEEQVERFHGFVVKLQPELPSESDLSPLQEEVLDIYDIFERDL